MIRKFLTVVAVVALVAVVAAPAQAGGSSSGGTKKVATIRVKNINATNTLGVSTAAPTADNTASLSAFQAAGGQVINPTQVVSYKVPAGISYLYGAATPTTAIADWTKFGVKGTAGQTGYVTADVVADAVVMAGSATKF